VQTTEENTFFFLYSAATDGSAEEIAHEALGDPRCREQGILTSGSWAAASIWRSSKRLQNRTFLGSYLFLDDPIVLV